MMSPDDPRHGTIAGHSAHARDKTPACGPCLAAKRADTSRRDYKRDRTDYRESGYNPGDGLGDGEWVMNPRKRVLEWVPVKPAPIVPELTQGKKYAHTTTCMDCGANLSEPAARCAPCRAESDRLRWRESKRKSRASAA